MWIHFVANYMVVFYTYCVSRQELHRRICGYLKVDLLVHYYYYYLLQLSFHSMAVVLTLVTNKNKYT